MKKMLAAMALFAVITAIAGAQAPDLLKMDVVERSVPDGPVAIVDGVAIEGKDYLRDYRRHLHNVMAMVADKKLTDEFRVHAGLTILGDLVREEILLKEALRRKVQVDQKDIEQEYQKKLGYFGKILEEETGAKPTEAQVLEKAGQDREQAIESVRRQLLVAKVSELLAEEKKVTVTDEEAKKYYGENPQLFQVPGSLHLNQILAVPKPNPSKADDKAWKKAEEQITRAKARIIAGEQFAAVARDMSEAPDAAKGGDMGMMPAGALPPFFVEAAKKMKPGEVSEPIRSEYGMHLVQLVATEADRSVTYDEASEKIRKVLMQAKMEEVVLQFCEPIVNNQERTKIFLQLERTLAATGKKEEAKPEPAEKKEAKPESGKKK